MQMLKVKPYRDGIIIIHIIAMDLFHYQHVLYKCNTEMRIHQSKSLVHIITEIQVAF